MACVKRAFPDYQPVSDAANGDTPGTNSNTIASDTNSKH
jgi:hypothetical protein